MGPLAASWGALLASLSVLGASWERLESVLERLGGVLVASRSSKGTRLHMDPRKGPESFKNRFKIATKIISQARTRSERAPTSIFSDFLQFLEAPGPPNIDPKSLKSMKNRTKIIVRKNQILQHYAFSIFRRFGLPKRIQNPDFFSFFEKFDFGKILTKRWLCAEKSKFRLLTIAKKSIQQRAWRRHRKRLPENRL